MPTSPLEKLGLDVTAIKDAILGTLDGRPGLAQCVRELRANDEAQDERLDAHEGRLTTLESNPGRRALDLWERVGLLAAGVALTAASQLIMSALKPPPTPPAQHGGAQR